MSSAGIRRRKGNAALGRWLDLIVAGNRHVAEPLSELELKDLQHAALERDLATREVEFPHTAERVTVELFSSLPVPVELFAPSAERVDVVQAPNFQVGQ